MEWFIKKRGYLVVIGLLAMSPIIALLFTSLLYNSWEMLGMISDATAISILIAQLIIGLLGFGLSVYEFRKNKTENLTNKIVGIVLNSSILLLYVIVLILMIEIFR